MSDYLQMSLIYFFRVLFRHIKKLLNKAELLSSMHKGKTVGVRTVLWCPRSAILTSKSNVL